MTTFKMCIDAAFPKLKNACADGKQALLNKDGKKIECKDPMTIRNSVALDDCANTIKEFTQENRWDYGLAIGKKDSKSYELVIWVEVHGATTSQVDCVLKKRDWLHKWLVKHAPDLQAHPGIGVTDAQ